MKKAFSLIFIIIFSLSLQGCTGIFGGIHRRELGEYTSFVSDGKNKYLECSIFTDDGYVEIEEGSFKIRKVNPDETSLYEVERSADIVLYDRVLETFVYDLEVENEYSYLSDKIFDAFDKPKNFEIIVLEKDGKLYGAINCYKRPSGRSGNLLSNEDLDKAYLFNVENEEIKITKTLEEAAVLALNESHYIAYSDKQFYSADKNSEEKVKICDDIWWDKGPTFYSYVDVHFVDDVFMIYGNRAKIGSRFDTLIVGDISGKHIETLIKDKKVE